MKKYLYSLFAFSLFTGCYEDGSSDRYNPIGSIEITGIESSYTKIALADKLKITPIVTSTDPSDNVAAFDYLWTVYTASDARRADKEPVMEFHTKDIAWPLDINADVYTLILQVTNPATRYSVYRTTNLTVNTMFSVGFYFLKETATGNTELDFHTPGGTLTPNLLTWQLGEPIAGEPVSLGFLVNPGSTMNHFSYMNLETGEIVSSITPALAVMGGKDTKIMRISDMTLIYDYDQFFFSGAAPDEKPVGAFLMGMMAHTAMFTEKGFYHAPRPTCRLSFPIGHAGTRITKVTKLDTFTPTYAAYDEGNGQLLYYAWGGTQIPLSSTNDYSPTGINCRALFMGTNNNSQYAADPNIGMGWSIFEDKETPSMRYLYRLMNIATAPITDVRTIPAEFKFNTAQVYATNKGNSAQMLYGGVGDKLYIYNTGSDTEILVSPAGMGAGEAITMITHKPGIHDPRDSSTPPANGYLVIATHKDGNYKVYLYNVVGGAPDGNPVKVYTGAGKVVDMQYAGCTSAYSPVL